MTKQLLIAQLRQGNNGKQLLDILDALAAGMDSSESSEDVSPTLDEIKFWNSTRCTTSSSGHMISTRPASSTRLHTSSSRSSCKQHQSHPSLEKQRIALLTSWRTMLNVSSSNTKKERSLLHPWIANTSSGQHLTMTQTGWYNSRTKGGRGLPPAYVKLPCA